MAAWLEWSWRRGSCCSLPGEGRLWGVPVELAGVRGTFLGVPELLLSWPWEWQVLHPLPGSKGKVHLFQLLEGKGRELLPVEQPFPPPCCQHWRLTSQLSFVAVILCIFFLNRECCSCLLGGCWLQLVPSCLCAVPGPAWVPQPRSVAPA